MAADRAEDTLHDDADIPVFVLPHDELKKLTGFELTRGALAAFRRPPLPPVENVLRGARRVAVLEDITNFTNVGAIFRSAAALGVDAVLVTPTCCDPLYRRLRARLYGHGLSGTLDAHWRGEGRLAAQKASTFCTSRGSKRQHSR